MCVCECVCRVEMQNVAELVLSQPTCLPASLLFARPLACRALFPGEFPRCLFFASRVAPVYVWLSLLEMPAVTAGRQDKRWAWRDRKLCDGVM